MVGLQEFHVRDGLIKGSRSPPEVSNHETDFHTTKGRVTRTGFTFYLENLNWTKYEKQPRP